MAYNRICGTSETVYSPFNNKSMLRGACPLGTNNRLPCYNKTMKKIIIGDATIDHYVHSGEKYAGGIAANFAAHLTRLGHTDISFISAVGNDRYADDFLQRIQEEGVDSEYVHKLPGKTSVQKIRINDQQWEYFGFTAGVLEDFLLSEDELEMVRNAEMVFLPLSDGLKPVFEQVMVETESKGIRMTDFSRHADIPGFGHGDIIAMIQHYIDAFDIVIAGGHQEHLEDMRTIAMANPDKVFVLTMGPEGSIGFHNGHEHLQPAIEIKEMVDTTGCGDAYRAGFINVWLEKQDLSKAMLHGAEEAAVVATHMGAF